ALSSDDRRSGSLRRSGDPTAPRHHDDPRAVTRERGFGTVMKIVKAITAARAAIGMRAVGAPRSQAFVCAVAGVYSRVNLDHCVCTGNCQPLSVFAAAR